MIFLRKAELASVETPFVCHIKRKKSKAIYARQAVVLHYVNIYTYTSGLAFLNTRPAFLSIIDSSGSK